MSSTSISNSLRAPSTLVLIAALLMTVSACDPPDKRQNGALAAREVKAQGATFRFEGSKLSDTDQKAVVASINGENISLGEYERRLNSQAPFARARYNSKERKLDFLNNITQFEALADEAEREGYASHPEVVLDFKQAMVRKMLADRIASEVKLEDITEAQMRAYYDEHSSDYIRPAKVRASQIVVADEETAKKIIVDLEADFKVNPTKRRKNFANMAREMTLDEGTKKLGGDMRFFTHPKDGGTVDPKVADAAFAIEFTGQLAPPLETDAGWHVIMLTAKKEREEKTFDVVKRNIQNRLFRELRTRKEKEFVKKVLDGAKIDIKGDLLDKIPDPPAPQEGDGHGHGAPIPSNELKPTDGQDPQAPDNEMNEVPRSPQ